MVEFACGFDNIGHSPERGLRSSTLHTGGEWQLDGGQRPTGLSPAPATSAGWAHRRPGGLATSGQTRICPAGRRRLRAGPRECRALAGTTVVRFCWCRGMVEVVAQTVQSRQQLPHLFATPPSQPLTQPVVALTRHSSRHIDPGGGGPHEGFATVAGGTLAGNEPPVRQPFQQFRQMRLGLSESRRQVGLRALAAPLPRQGVENAEAGVTQAPVAATVGDRHTMGLHGPLEQRSQPGQAGGGRPVDPIPPRRLPPGGWTGLSGWTGQAVRHATEEGVETKIPTLPIFSAPNRLLPYDSPCPMISPPDRQTCPSLPTFPFAAHSPASRDLGVSPIPDKEWAGPERSPLAVPAEVAIRPCRLWGLGGLGCLLRFCRKFGLRS